MNLDPKEIERLAKMTMEAKPAYVKCEDWIHMVGEYVEAASEGADLTTERLRIVREHAKDCPLCMEELRVLEGLLEGPSA